MIKTINISHQIAGGAHTSSTNISLHEKIRRQFNITKYSKYVQYKVIYLHENFNITEYADTWQKVVPFIKHDGKYLALLFKNEEFEKLQINIYSLPDVILLKENIHEYDANISVDTLILYEVNWKENDNSYDYELIKTNSINTITNPEYKDLITKLCPYAHYPNNTKHTYYNLYDICHRCCTGAYIHISAIPIGKNPIYKYTVNDWVIYVYMRDDYFNRAISENIHNLLNTILDEVGYDTIPLELCEIISSYMSIDTKIQCFIS